MLYHVMLGSSDIEKSRNFYNKVLGVLGVKEGAENVNATGQTRYFWSHAGKTLFSITEPINGQPATIANGSTIGFKCESAEQLKEFHATAIKSGATAVEDAPGPRGEESGGFHLCYFLDPDGHKICGIYTP